MGIHLQDGRNGWDENKVFPWHLALTDWGGMEKDIWIRGILEREWKRGAGMTSAGWKEFWWWFLSKEWGVAE